VVPIGAQQIQDGNMIPKGEIVVKTNPKIHHGFYFDKVESMVDLGVRFDNNLTFRDHISEKN